MTTDLQTRPFGVKFGEAIDYLKGKLPETTQAWDDLAGPIHGKVFTVAGATKVDLVRDLQRSLVSALENGTTITQFRKDFDQAVQQHGWTYKGKRGWRTSVIFDNNMRSAHMAEVLVVVPADPMPTDSSRWKKVVLRPNTRTKSGTGLSVVSLGSAQTRNLTEARYVTLVGGMPK